MRTVGEILSEKRKILGLSLEQAEEETKIRKKYLEAMEKDNYSFLPEVAVAKGFIRNYALFLGLSPETVLAAFRRDFSEDEEGRVVARRFSGELEKGFRWTPKLTFILTVSLIVFGFGVFFLKQYLRFSSPPELTVLSPKEGQVFRERVSVIGETEKDATVKIDGSLTEVDEQGNFKEEVVLPKGENILTVESANRQGRKRIVNIKVKVE